MQFIFFFVFILSYQVQAISEEISEQIVPIKIFVNTADKGEYFIVLDKRDVLISAQDFAELGVKLSGKIKVLEGQKYLSLGNLSPRLTYKLDENTLSLNLEVDPRYLQKNQLDLTENRLRENTALGIDSAFLNYAFIHRGTSNRGLETFELPLDGVISAHDWLFQSKFSYQYLLVKENVYDAYWSRGLSNLTRDFPNRFDRLIVGDLSAHSNELGGSGIFLGISYRKKYSMATYFSKYPGLAVNGLLQTPSKVNMYVNDVLIRSEQLSAGEFEIENLPNLYGGGAVKLETIDAFGRVSVRDVPYYISTKLLHVGLDDFSYSLGLQRDSLNAIRPTYSATPTFLAYHRWGIKKYLTAGYRFEFSEQMSNAGVNIDFLAGAYGEVSSGFSVSQFNSSAANAGYFRYGFTSQYFHTRYSIKSTQQNYATVSTLDPIVRIKQIQTIGAGVHGLKVGALSLNFTQIQYYKQMSSESWSLVYSLRVGRRTSLLFRGVTTTDIAGTNETVFASLNTTFGARTSASIAHSAQEDIETNSAYLQGSAPVGTGIGYRVRVSEEKNAVNETSYQSDVSLQGKMKYLTVTGDYFQGDVADSYQSNIAGSLAFIDNDYFLSRPIFDSFGLVKVGELDDIRIYYGNEVVDTTRNGELIIPNLTSYAENRLSIEAIDIPIDRSLKHTQKIVSPKLRTGSVVSFEVDRFQGYTGNLFLGENGQQKSADFADLKLQNRVKVVETVVGRKGEFYFENLSPGTYQGEVSLHGKRCQFSIDIPTSDEMMVELGKHVCTY